VSLATESELGANALTNGEKVKETIKKATKAFFVKSTNPLLPLEKKISIEIISAQFLLP
jgi:hypothetical protein